MDHLNVCIVNQLRHHLGGHWFSFIYFPIVGLSCTFIKPKSVDVIFPASNTTNEILFNSESLGSVLILF